MSRKITFKRALLGLAVASAFAGPLHASTSGMLDQTFGSNGIQTTSFSAGDDVALAAAMTSDERVILAGTADVTEAQRFSALRYLSNGNLDTTFATDGKAQVVFSATHIGETATSVTVDAAGRVLLAGYVIRSDGSMVPALARLLPNGAPDPEFGSTADGKVMVTGLPGDAAIEAVALDSKGRIVLTGWAENTAGNREFFTARMLTDGRFDVTFDENGWTLTPIGPSDDIARDLAILPDDRIVVAGGACDSNNCGPDGRYNFAFARYTESGALDPTFQDDGRLSISTAVLGYSNGASSLALQEDGKLVAAGGRAKGDDDFRQRHDFALVRIHADGRLDESFGDRGWTVTPIGLDASAAEDVAVMGDGRILAGGLALYNTVNTDFATMRYLPDGQVDYEFGNRGTGVITTAVGNGASGAEALLLQDDGAIVAAGFGDASTSQIDFAAVRYLAEDVTPSAFAFPAINDARQGELTASAAIRVDGFSSPTQIRAFQGKLPWENLAEYRVNNGEWTREPGMVEPGDVVQVRHTASWEIGGEVVTTLSAGGVHAEFTTVTTREPDGGGGAFSLLGLAAFSLPLLLSFRRRRA
ncbi:MAG: hypothetical protein ACP5DC_02870 [Halothiobacillaceae bacterium]